MAKQLVLTWAWRHHSLYADDFADSLEEAVGIADSAADYGTEALDCIEVWDANGYRKYTADEVWNLAERQRKGRPEPVYESTVAKVTIQAPDGGHSTSEGFTSIEKAEARAAELAEFLGDRVKVDVLANQT